MSQQDTTCSFATAAAAAAKEEEKKESPSMDTSMDQQVVVVAPSTPSRHSNDPTSSLLATPDSRMFKAGGDDDDLLLIPQLHHSFLGSADKREVNVTADTAPSELSEFSPSYSERHRGEEELEPPPRDDDDDSDHGGVDTDSSNDESSYFADPNNLPSPKSGSRHHFSHSSISSLNNRSTSGGRDCNRESDASLSLSDDSSDDGVPAQPVGFPGHEHHQRGVPELYPHPITRMHSVSSLVSTSSQNSTDNEELKDVVEGGQRSDSARPTPSGRKSPVLGQHPPSRVGPFFQSPTFNASPPTILSVHPPLDFPHPQPHLMTPDELDIWEKANAMSRPFVATSTSFETKEALHASAPTKGSEERRLTPGEDTEEHGHRKHGGAPAPTFHNPSTGPPGSLDRGALQPKRDANHPGPPGSGPWSDTAPDAKGAIATGHSKYDRDETPARETRGQGFKVYWRRWLMLMYMSVLNLLSDWTCYSVAPIAVLTREAFGSVNAERLVVVFLGANALATACEPIILSRLGLRRTVLFGALLLMIGSIIKSGGMPPIIQAKLEKGEGEWRVYLGFFMVGLSQPLYQCTPALLSASWFPERERTLATGVALNANQVGIGFAFIFGTLLVSTSDDIPAYFGLLSIISTIVFIGVLIQFDDAPPTPPSDTARVMRGTLDVGLPNIGSIFNSVKNFTNSPLLNSNSESSRANKPASRRSTPSSPESNDNDKDKPKNRSRARRTSRSSGRSNSSSRRQPTDSGNSTRRRTSRPSVPESKEDPAFHGLAPAPSPAHFDAIDSHGKPFPAPSPMLPGSVGAMPVAGPPSASADDNSRRMGALNTGSAGQTKADQMPSNPFLPPGQALSGDATEQPYQNPGASYPAMGAPLGYPGQYGSTADEGYYGFGYGDFPHQGQPHAFSQPVWDPYYQQYVYFALPPDYAYQQPNAYNSYQNAPQTHQRYFQSPEAVLPSPSEPIDIGAEPVLTITPHHLDIDIRDDQILLSTRACLSRPGFIHALVAFTVSGVVINTLSTFMDYLVRLNGAGREYTGIVGGSFQFVIMISSLIVGQFTDRTRAYYSVTVGMLVLGAFALAECGVNLDSDRGVELRWSLVIVAALVGPLQPVSTELGVDVVYPLSENTVLVIQQLFANLLSAMFIPCFKAFKNFGLKTASEGASEQPEYTFSFYVLIVIHAAATVFFATFNGRYLRYEHELEKKAQSERREDSNDSSSFYGPPVSGFYGFSPGEREQRPLIPPIV